MVQGSLLRLAGLLLAAIVGWTLLRAYAGTLFLICTAVAAWRLWRVAADLARPAPARGPPQAEPAAPGRSGPASGATLLPCPCRRPGVGGAAPAGSAP